MCRLIVLLISLLLLSSCAAVGAGMDTLDSRTEDEFSPEVVSSVPSGFIPLNVALADMDGVMNSFFWSNNFGFQDSERVTIFQTNVKNNDFIVMYRNDIYINEEAFLEIATYAKSIYEQMNREYSIGDKIEFRGAMHGNRVVFSVKIISVERVDVSESTLYEIKFSVYPDVPKEHLLEMFDFVETVDGMKYYDFVLIDSSTVHVEIGGEALLGVITLSNFGRPHITFSFQNSIRRVRINAENWGIPGGSKGWLSRLVLYV